MPAYHAGHQTHSPHIVASVFMLLMLLTMQIFQFQNWKLHDHFKCRKFTCSWINDLTASSNGSNMSSCSPSI